MGHGNDDLPPRYLNTLSKLSEKLHNASFFEMAFHRGHVGVKFKQFAGLVHVARNLSIEILPKLDSQKSGNDVLAHMVSYTARTPSVLGAIGQVSRFDSMEETLIGMTVAEILKQLSQGLHRDFHTVKADLPSLRGQVHHAGQVARYGSRRDRFVQQVLSPSFDTPINRTILAGLREMMKIVSSQRLKAKIRSGLETLKDAEVGIFMPSDRLVVFNRLTQRWQHGYQLSLQWLDHIRPGLRIGVDALGPTMLFDMNKLFESYVGQCLRNSLGDIVHEQQSEHYLFSNADGRSVGLLRPDFLIDGNFNRAVVETKWKVAPSETASFYQPGDLRQVFAYAKVLGVSNVFLVYPTMSDDVLAEIFTSNTDPSINLTSLTLPIIPSGNDGREKFIAALISSIA